MTQVIAGGKLVSTPVVRETKDGDALVLFTIVAKRTWQTGKKGKPVKDFVRCIAWGTQAQKVIRLAKVGCMMKILGTNLSDFYEDCDGIRYNGQYVLAEDVYDIGDTKEKVSEDETERHY